MLLLFISNDFKKPVKANVRATLLLRLLLFSHISLSFYVRDTHPLQAEKYFFSKAIASEGKKGE
jgi:hypothetical protein